MLYIGNTRYKPIVNGEKASFVTEYKPPYDAEIEYLESTGTQIINTGYIPTGVDNDIYITFTPIGYLSGASNYASMAFAAYTSESSRTYRIIRNNGNNSSVLLYDGSKASGGGKAQTISLGTKYTLTMTHDFKYTINGTNGTLTNSSGTENTTQLSLMNSCVRIYSFRWVKNGVKILDLIPVRVGTTGYLYDRVSKQLFGNSGTGNFTLGNDIIPINYLESTSNINFIDLPIIPTAETGACIKTYILGSGDRFFFGCRNNTSNTRWCMACNNDYYAGYGSLVYGYGTYNNRASIGKLNYYNDKKYIITSAGANVYGEYTTTFDLPTLGFTPTNNIRLFGAKGLDQSYMKWTGRYYFCKITQGSQLTMDLIPVRISQVGYMFDKISRVLYGNSGSGNFILGSDKI